MKKFLVFLVALTFGLATVSAMTEAELKEKLYEGITINNATFKPNDQQKTAIERYLDTYEVSSADADYAYEKMLAVFDVLKASGKQKFQDMSAADKASVVALVAEVNDNTGFTCAIVDGVFIVYEPETSTAFYKDPVYPIAQTNRDLIAAGLGIISVLGMALAFRKIKNA